MSAPADLNRILEELASGKITAAQAATLIEELKSPGGQPRVDVEALYDSPPTRALPDEPGAEPTEAEALVGILALEAQRAQALVVGEDLGTVEPWVRDYLARRGILGTSVLWFEAGLQGEPLDAQWWREYCMASVTTHDLPPTLGYLDGEHVRIRDDLGLLTEPLDDELRVAAQERAAWLGKLVDIGVLAPDKVDDSTEVMLALHRYLLLTPSKVLLANLTDAVGERRAQNMPGTVDEYPNWRVPLHDAEGRRIELEDVFSARLPQRLAAVMNGLPEQPASRWERR